MLLYCMQYLVCVYSHAIIFCIQIFVNTMATAATQMTTEPAESPSMSVSDARKRFEMMSGGTGSVNDIHTSPRKSKPPLIKVVTSPALESTQNSTSTKKEPNVEAKKAKATGTSSQTKQASKAKKNSPVLSSKSFSLSLSKKKTPRSNSDSKRISRTDSDVTTVDSKKSKFFKTKMEGASKTDNGKSGGSGSSPKRSQSNSGPTTTPTHTGLNGGTGTGKKRREPPRPPSQPGSPEHMSPSPPKSPVKTNDADKDTKGAKGKLARPPSPKGIKDDKGSGAKRKTARPPSPKDDKGGGAKSKAAIPPSPSGIKDENLKVTLSGGKSSLPDTGGCFYSSVYHC